MLFWLEEDVWGYLKTRQIPYCKIYDSLPDGTPGERRTGCMWCMFGVHLEKEPNRFQRMQHTHPKIWDYCIHRLGLGVVLDTIGVPYENRECRKDRLRQMLTRITPPPSASFPKSK